MSIRPMGDNVLIRVDPETDQIATESGVKLFKPQGAHEHVLATAEVVATGPGKLTKSGVRSPTGVEPGEGIVFVKFVATYTETGKSIQHAIGKGMALIKPNDIFLVYDRKNPPKFTQ